MSSPRLIMETPGQEVLRVGVYLGSPNSIRLSIDGVTQDNIKSVDLLAFMTESHRKSNKRPS